MRPLRSGKDHDHDIIPSTGICNCVSKSKFDARKILYNYSNTSNWYAQNVKSLVEEFIVTGLPLLHAYLFKNSREDLEAQEVSWYHYS